MCGIVGCINNLSKDILIKALLNLEYRGYDSSGIMIYNDKVNLKKSVGKVSNLLPVGFDGRIGIAHTRWATTGKVCLKNSHPHTTSKKRFYIVHNGIIKNHLEIKEELFENEIFLSDTDSEIISHLLDYYIENNDILNSLKLIEKKLVGSYAVIIFDVLNPTFLFTISKDMPLFLSVDRKIISSDIVALIDCKKFVSIENRITSISDNYEIYDYNLNKCECEIFKRLDSYSVSKQGYEHYMLKEIHDSLEVIKDLYDNYITKDIKVSDCNIVGCGSSYYASMIGKYLLDDLYDIDVYVASEFKYKYKEKLTILVSQSGETKDILDLLKLNLNFISITNNQYSSLAFKTKNYDLCAKKEISVAATKSFFAEVVLFSIIRKKALNQDLTYLNDLYDDVLKILNMKILDTITNRVIIIAQGVDYYVALEFALKLKETSYIDSYAIIAGELKHGTLALVDNKTTIIGISSNKLYDSAVNQALEECKSRGGLINLISHKNFDFKCEFKFIPIIIYIELLSYYKALSMGVDIDCPRNLAKSVTVE